MSVIPEAPAPVLKPPRTAGGELWKLALLAGLVCLGASVFTEALFDRAERGVRRVRLLVDRSEPPQPLEALPLSESPPELPAAGEMAPVRACAIKYCPIVRWAERYPTHTRDGRPAYIYPELLYTPGKGTPRPAGNGFRYFSMLAAALLTAGGARLLLAGGRRKWRLACGLAALRWASLFWIFGVFGFFSIHVVDEHYYFGIAEKLLRWSGQHDAYPYTLGLPLLYLPLLAAGAWRELPFTVVYAAAMFPLLSLLLFRALAELLDGLGASARAILFAGLVVALYSWLFTICHAAYAGESALFTFFGQWVEQPADTYWMGLLYYADFVGWNALSDTPALVCALLGLALLLRALRSGRSAALAGAVLGFACLVRLAAVYALPAAAYLFIVKIPKRKRLKKCLPFCAAFAAAVLPQLAWNWAIFGNPLTLGYAARPRTYNGFELSSLPQGIVIVASLHLALLSCGVLSWLLLLKKRPGMAAPLALLALPTLIFYSGYAEVGVNPVRFLLLPLTVTFIVIGLALAEAEHKRLAAACFLLPFFVVPNSPFGPYLLELPKQFAPAMFLLAGAVVYRKLRDWRYVAFFLLLAAGRPEPVFAAFATTCLAAIIYGFGKPPEPEPGCENVSAPPVQPPGHCLE